MFKVFLLGILAHLGMFSILNNRGEVGDGKGNEGTGTLLEKPVTTQEQFDRMVSERIARERSKFGDYEELKKFRDEHAKEQDKIKQDELIRQKKFEEAEGTLKKQLAERDSLLSEKDKRIQDMTISSTLSQEISKQNGFVEETIALLRNNATLTKDGIVTIKLRDSNGIEKEVSVEEGLKQFYAARPHLVRAKGTNAGSGTPPAGTGGGAGSDDLGSLNTQLIQAMSKGDRKTAEEIKKKIKASPLIGNSRAL